MKRTLVIFVFAAAYGVSALVAQNAGTSGNPGNFVQRHVKFLTTLLSLPGAQQQQATTIFADAATADASVHSGMSAARQALKSAVQGNDTAAIEQAAATIGSLTAQTTANQGKADAAFYQILTPAQQTKLAQFESQSHGRMGGGMGPAGFHERY